MVVQWTSKHENKNLHFEKKNFNNLEQIITRKISRIALINSWYIAFMNLAKLVIQPVKGCKAISKGSSKTRHP